MGQQVEWNDHRAEDGLFCDRAGNKIPVADAGFQSGHDGGSVDDFDAELFEEWPSEENHDQ